LKTVVEKKENGTEKRVEYPR